MKKRKRNKFWTFWFSFMPGAVEMYMGFMKMGLSLMSLFLLGSFVTTVLNIGPFLFVVAIIWFYGFFHARNMVALSDEEIEGLEDTYLLDFGTLLTGNMKNVIVNQKVVAYAMLVIGVYLVWEGILSALSWILPDQMYYLINGINAFVTRGALGILIVYIGYRLIQGRRIELVAQTLDGTEDTTNEISQKIEERGAEDDGYSNDEE